MKKFTPLQLLSLALSIFLSVGNSCFSQSVGINSTGAAPHAAALLDLSSTTKGTLITRMTTAQRDAIASPPEGLQIYNLDCHKLNVYDGTAWVDMVGNPIVAAPVQGSHTASATQIIWNWNTVSGASGYKWNTINVYGSATDVGTNTTYTQTGLSCGNSYTLYVWAYNACGVSSSTLLSQSTIACFTCGGTLTITHTAGTVAPETKTVNYGTVTTSISGASKCWITQNLGATNQAGSSTDNTDAAAGWYWQFNRKQGYKTSPLTPAWTITSTSENSAWLAANDPCTIELGAGWRVPTYTEWSNADAAWSNYNDTYASVLKIHASGYLYAGDGGLNNRGVGGVQWSSTQFNNTEAWSVNIGSSYSLMNETSKAHGLSVRCIKD